MFSDGKNKFLGVGLNDDVTAAVVGYYKLWREQPEEIVTELVGCDLETQCYSIFDYIAKAIHYKVDPDGAQYVKSPARFLKDGEGDCKSFAVFIASCLHCLGVPHIIRFVNFDGGWQYTHVYVVAEKDGETIILDPVEKDEDGDSIYNYAREFKKKYDVLCDRA